MNMKNIYQKFVCIPKKGIMLLFLLSCSFMTAMSIDVVRDEVWNGRYDTEKVGEKILLHTVQRSGDSQGFKAQIRFGGGTFDKNKLYIHSDFESWISDGLVVIQPTGNGIYGENYYCVSYDAMTQSFYVEKGRCGAGITPSAFEVCPGETVTLRAVQLEDVTTWSWGYLSETDTTWLDNDDATSIDIVLQKPTTFVLKYTMSGRVKVISQLVNASLSNCGYWVRADNTSVCPGQEVVLSTNYTGASTYVWKDQSGMTIATSTTPTVSVAPTSATVYSLYVNNDLVGSVSVKMDDCQFYITSYYPTSVCIQDSNHLTAIGERVIGDIDRPVFTWEYSYDGVSWNTISGHNSSRLNVAPEQNTYYRVSYNGLKTPSFFYEVPDCSQNEDCEGLQSRVLFYETFGYFLDENTYVNGSNVYKDYMTMYGTVSAVDRNGNVIGTAGNTQGPGTNYLDMIRNEQGYYRARYADSTKLVVSDQGLSYFRIAKYVAPDPNGYVVTATKFKQVIDDDGKISRSNQYVGTNGHLFLHANPVLPLYDWCDDKAYRLQDGYYAIVTNPDSVDRHDHGDYLDCSDATGNVNGAMLFVNSGETKYSKSAIYAQKVELTCAADRFSFSMNVRNATKKEFSSSDPNKRMNPVNISVILLADIDGTGVLPISYRAMDDIDPANVLNRDIESGDLPSASTEWKHIEQYVQLEPGKKVHSLWVVLYNNGLAGDGNDMLIDDIMFSVCLPKAELSANIDGNLITGDVVVCDGRDVELVATQKGDYIKNPVYLFQYQDKDTKDWVDMLDYDDALSYNKTNVIVSVTDPRFVGNVKYRVIIGSSVNELRTVASNPTDVCNEFLVAESDINVMNMYGGPMCPDQDKRICYVEGDSVYITGCRSLIDPNHTYKIFWKDSQGNIVVDTTEVTGISSDSVKLVIGENKTVSIYDRNNRKVMDTDFDGIATLTYVARDADICEHEQKFTLSPKHIVELSFDGDTATGCDSILVHINKDVPDAHLIWNWSIPGQITEVDDATQIFRPDGLSETSSISGMLYVKVDNSGDDFCASAEPLEIPYTVQNVSFTVKTTPSGSPVCVTPGQDDDTPLMSFTASTSPINSSFNILKYNWRLVYGNGDVVDTTTDGRVLVMRYRDLVGHVGMTLSASIISTETAMCGVISNPSSTETSTVEIRTGAFTLTLEALTKEICLKTSDTIFLKASFSSAAAVKNLKTFNIYDANHFYNHTIDIIEGDSVYFDTIVKSQYPDIFVPGMTETFYMSALDEECSGTNRSLGDDVNLNGYEFTLQDPGGDGKECLAPGDKLPITATLDNPDAENLIKSFQWYMDDKPMGGTGLSFDFVVEKSGTYEFKLVLSDGICEDVADSILVEVGVNEPVVIDCDSLRNTPIERVVHGECSIPYELMNLEYPIGVDGCSSEKVQGEGRRTSGKAMTDPYPVGRDTIIWSFRSKYSNIVITCEQYVYIQSDFPPIVPCDSINKSPIERVAHGTCEIPAELMNINIPNGKDYCTDDKVPGVGRRTSGRSMTDPYPVGRDTIIWTFDSEYSTVDAVCEQYVWVRSDMPLDFNCDSLKNDTIKDVLHGECEVSAEKLNIQAPVATDVCTQNPVTAIGVRKSGRSMTDSYMVGYDTIMWIFENDYTTIIDTCEQYVHIQSDIEPEFNCNSLKDTFLFLKLDECKLPAGVLVLPEHFALDACTKDSVPGVPTREDGKGLNEEYPRDTTVIKWTFTSIHSTTPKICYQNVIVRDTFPPEYDCSLLKDLSVAVDEDSPANDSVSYEEVVARGLTIPTYEDFCDGTIEGIPVRSDGKGFKENYPVGTTIITWDFKDKSGNSKYCEQEIFVTNEQILDCPQDLDGKVFACTEEVPAPYQTFEEFKKAGGAISDESKIDPSSFTYRETLSNDSCNSIFTRTYVVLNKRGIEVTCDQVMSIKDTVAPDFSVVLSDITVGCKDEIPTGDDVKAIDNCDPNPTLTLSETNNRGTDTLSCEYYNYDIVRTYKAVDRCGNENTMVQTIRVRDTVPPYFVEPIDWNSYTLADLMGLCEFFAPNLYDKIKDNIIDECTGKAGIRVTQTPEPGARMDSSMYVSLKIEDLCGNDTTLVKFVKVQHKEVIIKVHTFDIDSCVTDDRGISLNSQSVRYAEGSLEYIDEFDGAIGSTRGTFVYDYYRGKEAKYENLMFSNNPKTYWHEFEKKMGNSTNVDSLIELYATLHMRSESGYYTIVAMDTLSGCPDTATLYADVKERPKVVVESGVLPVCENSPVDLSPFVRCIDNMGSDSLNTYWKKDGVLFDYENPVESLVLFEDNGKTLVFYAENECGVTSSLNSHLSLCLENLLTKQDTLNYFNNNVAKYDSLVANLLYTSDSVMLNVHKRYNPGEITITTDPSNPARIWVGEGIILSASATYGYDYLVWHRVAGEYDLRNYDAYTATSDFEFDDPDDEEDVPLAIFRYGENTTIIDMPADTSYYYVTVTNGVCPAVPSALTKVNVLPEVPTAFTPHTKDGLNDIFMERHHVVIFDRYGQKIFVGDNGWDGTYNGRMADPGVYYHQVKMSDGSLVNGTIEIIKIR